MTSKTYKTRLSGCPKQCAAIGCCLNCNYYDGAIEFIPTVMHVDCKAGNKNVVLKLHGYPKISNKQTDKKSLCQQWVGHN